LQVLYILKPFASYPCSSSRVASDRVCRAAHRQTNWCRNTPPVIAMPGRSPSMGRRDICRWPFRSMRPRTDMARDAEARNDSEASVRMVDPFGPWRSRSAAPACFRPTRGAAQSSSFSHAVDLAASTTAARARQGVGADHTGPRVGIKGIAIARITFGATARVARCHDQRETRSGSACKISVIRWNPKRPARN